MSFILTFNLQEKTYFDENGTKVSIDAADDNLKEYTIISTFYISLLHEINTVDLY